MESMDSTSSNSDDDLPVRILRMNTRKLLSDTLNSTKVIRSHDGLCRDWRGFAHLCGVQLTNCGKNKNPMEEVFLKWQETDDATVRKLFQFLEKLDRFDIIADSEVMINEDVQFYLTACEQIPLPLTQLALGSSEQQILTVDDIYRRERGLEPLVYDAVVLYDEKDWDVVQILVTQLEQDNFKLCLKDRDIMPGVSFEHETFMTLIKDRCNRVIILLSPNFLQCPFNNFLQLYAQAVSIEERQRKVIPCLYKFPSRKDVPKEFKFYTMLSYDDLFKWPDNFWKRLKASITAESYSVPTSTVQIREMNSLEYSKEVTRELRTGECSNSDKNVVATNSANQLLTLNSDSSLNEFDYIPSCDSNVVNDYVNESEKKRTFFRIRKLFKTLVTSKSNLGKDSKKKIGVGKCALAAE